MNSAAEELNSLQNALNARMQQRRKLVQQWARSLVRALPHGVDLVKVAAYHERLHRCKLAKRAVALASSRYLAAVDGGASEPEVARLTVMHIRHLKLYQTEQRRLIEAQRSSNVSTDVLQASQPYFEVEATHLKRLAEADRGIDRLSTRLDVVKACYSNAMRALEALSEDAHRRRVECDA
jgi:Iap family predicted aminopeptidase